MNIAEYKRDVWGREVLLGASWELLWVVIALAFTFIALHAIVMATRKRDPKPSDQGTRVARHAGIDRLFHWVMAVSVFVLLLTGVLPIVGIEFSWLTIHWIAGLVFTAVCLFHILRAIFAQDLLSMWIGPKDFKEPFDEAVKPGKYSFAQKSMHAAVTVLSIVVIGSGLTMFAMIDTPWWDRTNSLSEATLGWMFLLHGLSTLALIAVISLHVYFGLRPEKLFYTRSMIKGWISEDELKANHDPAQWTPEESA